jgi:hypothetical protein
LCSSYCTLQKLETLPTDKNKLKTLVYFTNFLSRINNECIPTSPVKRQAYKWHFISLTPFWNTIPNMNVFGSPLYITKVPAHSSSYMVKMLQIKMPFIQRHANIVCWLSFATLSSKSFNNSVRPKWTGKKWSSQMTRPSFQRLKTPSLVKKLLRGKIQWQRYSAVTKYFLHISFDAMQQPMTKKQR